MNKVENYVAKHLPKELGSYAPSAKLVAYQKGNKVFEYQWGKDYRFFDLASLTKIIFTNQACIHLTKTGDLNVNEKIKTYLPWFKGETKVINLLSHTSGFSWWKSYYKNLADLTPDLRWLGLKELISQERGRPTRKATYSDLDYFFLAFILQEILNRPLADIWEPLSFGSLHFNSRNQTKYKREHYAPTEKCLWRKRLLQGEVHDENAWALGGVSTHAGLFGTIDDLASYGLLLRKQFRNATASEKVFYRRVVKDWTAGFMQPSFGSSSSGKYFSPQSIGHTGFTGTSFWFDPKKDLFIAIVSNRVSPSRKNKKFVGLRPVIHNLIMEGLGYV